jgi:zinc/manganese transport system substrate-binding protein
MNPTRRAFALALLPLPLLAQAEPPLKAVASFSILADWVREVGGDAVAVQALVGPDADAHVFQPRPQHARQVAEAELVFLNGLGFEGWLPRLLRASGSKARAVTVTDGLDARLPGSGRRDPHIWQHPAHARHAVQRIADALAAARPSQAEGFRSHAAAYQQQLTELQAWAEAQFARLPAAQRHVVTSHDAFGHLGAAFGLRFSAPQGWSTQSEPSAKAVAALIQQLKTRQARAVFLENISDPKLVRRIAEEAGARVGGTLYSDALSGPSGPAATYLALMRHNLNTLLEALQ